MDDRQYIMVDNGFAMVIDEIGLYQYFDDHDIIGKTVKHVGLYGWGRDSEYCKPADRNDYNKPKLVLNTLGTVGFVCEFTDGTYMAVDSIYPGYYFKYGSGDHGIKCFDPSRYDHVLDHMAGDEFYEIRMPYDFYIYKNKGLVERHKEYDCLTMRFRGPETVDNTRIYTNFASGTPYDSLELYTSCYDMNFVYISNRIFDPYVPPKPVRETYDDNGELEKMSGFDLND